ncbi:hypothetical protein [Catellatospora sp. NPDC049609]|uniref:hypothetical protein n=1 Tax=Catellatospora sp. NPDC049609 TaxID=3155505 RepID=UPI00342FD702
MTGVSVLRLVIDLGEAPPAHELVGTVRALTHLYEIGLLASAAAADSRFRDDALTLLRIGERVRTDDAAAGSPVGTGQAQRLEVARRRYERSANEIVWAGPLRIQSLSVQRPLDIALTHRAVTAPMRGYGAAALGAIGATVLTVQDHLQRAEADPAEPEPDDARDARLRAAAETGFWQPFGAEARRLIVAADREKLARSLLHLARRRPRLG